MFKLLRDSIFNPKNIIAYRAKKVGFTLLYMIFLALIMGLSTCASSFSYKELGYTEKMELMSGFNNSNAKITDGVYKSDNTFTVKISRVNLTFVKDKDSIKDVKEEDKFVVLGDGLYLLIASYPTNQLYKLDDLTNLSQEFNTINLVNLTEDSVFFTELNKVVLVYRNYVIAGLFMTGFFQAFVFMLGYALLTYFFMVVFFRIGDFMKKGQLFKMLIYASTSVILMESLMILFNVNAVYSWLLILISFIPLYLLEREIIKRIKMKIIGSSFSNDQGLINKINDFIKNQQEEEYDADEEDDNRDDEDLGE